MKFLILSVHFHEHKIHRYTRTFKHGVTNGPLIMLMVSTYVYIEGRGEKKKVNIVIFRWSKAVEHPMIVFRSAKSYAICIRRA